jgi:hypothetical protein
MSHRGTTRPRGEAASARAIRPGTWRNDPLSPSSPQKETLGAVRSELAGGSEQADRDREVEAGTALADTGGSEIDRQAPEGPWQPAGEDGGTYLVPRLANRGIGQTDDGESRQTVGHVDLDRDGASHGAVQRRRCDGGLHAGERSGARPKSRPKPSPAAVRTSARLRGSLSPFVDGDGDRDGCAEPVQPTGAGGHALGVGLEGTTRKRQ